MKYILPLNEMKDGLETNINKVIEGDCMAGLKKLPDSCVDLVVTDPPYFIENLKEDLKEQTIRGSSRNSIFHADWDSSFGDLDGYKYFILRWLKELKRVLKPKGQCYIFFSYHHIHWMREMVEQQGFRFYKYLIWYKPDIMGVFPNQYGCNYEVILWFRNDGKGGEVKLNIGCGQRDLFICNSTNIRYRKECGFHPTPKPIQIIRQLIKNGSDEGDLVLDSFMGSGTTAVGCKQTKRNFIGTEMSHEYNLITEKRLCQDSFLSLEDYAPQSSLNNLETHADPDKTPSPMDGNMGSDACTICDGTNPISEETK